METYSHGLLIISLILFYSAEALCVPRNFTDPPSSDSSSSMALPPDSQPQSSMPPASPPLSQQALYQVPISPQMSKPEETPSPDSSAASDQQESSSSSPPLSDSESDTSPPSPPVSEPDSDPDPGSDSDSSPSSQEEESSPPPLEFSTPEESNHVGPPIRLPFGLHLKPPLTHLSVIKNICMKTDHPSLCISSITPFLTGNVDPMTVLRMAIKACSQTAQIAFAVATRMAKNPGLHPMTASYVDQCKDSYTDAMDNLRAAIDALVAHDIGTLNSMLSAAMTDFGTCGEGFAETPGANSPMAAYVEMLRKLASNCLAIASLIK